MKKVMDGNEATAYISYALTEAVSLFPITPSSPMSEAVEEWAVQKKNNSFGYPVSVIPMESETGVAGTMHGLLKSGVLTTTYTCSQGLLLMIPALYKMAGELLPAVLHVSARSIATSALSIHGDHSDVMATRQTGAVLLASGTVQESALFSAVAHIAAQKGRLPIIHFFDGFQTSHELRKIEIPSYEEIKKFVDFPAVSLFKQTSLSNFSPRVSGTAQNPDLFFQQRESANIFYLAMEKIIERTIQELNPLFGTNCSSVEFFGSAEAKDIVVIMGSAQETVKQVVNQRVARGEKVGVLVVHLYRPFPEQLFLERMPQTVECIAVLDRTKEPGATGEPLLLDVQQVCGRNQISAEIIGGRYGLGGKETTPDQIHAVFDEMQSRTPKKEFTIGITDNVTELSLETKGGLHKEYETDLQVQIWGFGSDGSVSGAQDFVKVIGQETTNDVQACFHYSSNKSRGLTRSYIRVNKEPIQAAYSVQSADIVLCSKTDYLHSYNLIDSLKDGGILFINTQYSCEELSEILNKRVKQQLEEKKIHLYTLPADQIAQKYQLGAKINTLMISGLFYLTNLLDLLKALASYKKLLLEHSFMENEEYKLSIYAAINESIRQIKEIRLGNDQDTDLGKSNHSLNEVAELKEIVQPINQLNGQAISTGDILKNGCADGSFPLGLSQYMPNTTSDRLPCWDSQACVQCNLCAFVCPHGAIRPFLLNEEQEQNKPSYCRTTGYTKDKQYQYRLQMNPEKCTGCTLCEEVCLSKGKAIQLQPSSKQFFENEKENWAYMVKHNSNQQERSEKLTCTTIGFVEPLSAFSGACAGCGETPYVTLLTQLFGERLSLANATGCSSIWGASAPYTAFYKNEAGQGPTWANSLLENNSAFGYGMELGHQLIREQCYHQLAHIAKESSYPSSLRTLCKRIIQEEGKNIESIAQLLEQCAESEEPVLQAIIQKKKFLLNRTQWIVGGDGWAYDIDFNGIDHLLSTGKNVNILILDNEGFSNTGGQLSKGTPIEAKLKFASSGNKRRKKDLGFYALQHENVYVAQIALFANPQQTLKALEEAEAYQGVSVVIAYSPCITHKRKNSAIASSKEAVKSGYWPLYRFNPVKNKPMSMDSQTPEWGAMKEFLLGDSRFRHLDESSEVLDEVIMQTQKRYFQYQLVEQISANLN